MKKKFFSILVTAAVCLSLTGCSALNSILSNLSESSVASESQPANTVFARGTWNNNVYTNDFFDVRVTLPINWTIATDEEIATTFDVDLAQMSSDNDFSKIYVIYDMAMADVSSGTNIVLMAENLAASLGGTSVTEEGYLDIIDDTLEEQGFTIGDISDIQLGGYHYKKLETVYSEGTCQDYYIRRIGNYMMCIIGSYLPDYADTYQAALASIEKKQQ